MHFAMELGHFVCNCATPTIIEKLQSKGVAMHAYDISVYRIGWKSIKWTWAELFKIKIEQGSNFIVNNEAASIPKKLKR